ncbi:MULTISPECIES: pantoate--beta-alanine ligase [unclassified Paraflavitalea]|uniref:pantoate--beta-alanine ligase n=1 Tax=unclassified Paraflavitalea TaxID=2798305 RepID=UPI003D32889E
MIIFKHQKDLSNFLQKQVNQGATIGFVPTMGALHAGHASLISESKKHCKLTVCSIFVNPTQFNDTADFAKYPKTIESDIALLESLQTEVLYLPEVSDLYPSGTQQLEHYDLGKVADVLEGPSRPGHFQGVCQVVNRLLMAVQPHQLFMGQKDFQQCRVVARLLELTNSSVKLVTCPTLREPSGLAMSSRNMRLSEVAKQKAAAIYQALNYINSSLKPGPIQTLTEEACSILEKAGFKIDYLKVCNYYDLSETDQWNGTDVLVILIAAYIDDVRLIDNMIVSSR